MHILVMTNMLGFFPVDQTGERFYKKNALRNPDTARPPEYTSYEWWRVFNQSARDKILAERKAAREAPAPPAAPPPASPARHPPARTAARRTLGAKTLEVDTGGSRRPCRSPVVAE